MLLQEIYPEKKIPHMYLYMRVCVCVCDLLQGDALGPPQPHPPGLKVLLEKCPCNASKGLMISILFNRAQ